MGNSPSDSKTQQREGRERRKLRVYKYTEDQKEVLDGDCYEFWQQRLVDNQEILTPVGAKGVIFKVSKSCHNKPNIVN